MLTAKLQRNSAAGYSGHVPGMISSNIHGLSESLAKRSIESAERDKRRDDPISGFSGNVAGSTAFVTFGKPWSDDVKDVKSSWASRASYDQYAPSHWTSKSGAALLAPLYLYNPRRQDMDPLFSKEKMAELKSLQILEQPEQFKSQTNIIRHRPARPRITVETMKVAGLPSYASTLDQVRDLSGSFAR